MRSRRRRRRTRLHPVFELWEADGEAFWHCAATGDSAWALPPGADSACGWRYVGSRRGGWQHAVLGITTSSSVTINRHSHVNKEASGAGAASAVAAAGADMPGEERVASAAGVDEAGVDEAGEEEVANEGEARHAWQPPAEGHDQGPSEETHFASELSASSYYHANIAAMQGDSEETRPSNNAHRIVEEVQAFVAKQAQRKR